MNGALRYGIFCLCILRSIQTIASITHVVNNTPQALALTITHTHPSTQGQPGCTTENITMTPFSSYDYLSTCCPWTMQAVSPLHQKTVNRLGVKVTTPIPITIASPEDCEDSTITISMSLSGLRMEIKHSPIQGAP